MQGWEAHPRTPHPTRPHPTLLPCCSERGHFTMLLDGDNIRHGLNKNLGFR